MHIVNAIICSDPEINVTSGGVRSFDPTAKGCQESWVMQRPYL